MSVQVRARRRRGGALAVAMLGLLAAATACSAPGSPQAQGTAGASAAPATSTASATSAAAACGTAPVTMDAYIETGFQVPNSLMAEFTKQYPNVKWNIRQDQFAVITQNAPRVLASDPPDIMRLPSISDLVKDGLLKNLDGYATAYGWDKWPSSELVQLRLGPGGRPRGEGSLYAMGLNYSMTGVFYNKKLAARIGMTSAPATLAELDQDLAKAKQAGITPIVQFNGGATGGFAFPLQDLMAAYGPPGPINDWIFNKPGATINTPANLQAAQHLAQWIKAGYFEADANAMDYPTMISRFTHNSGLFTFDGDWESGNFDKLMPGQAGFFLMPPAQAGGPHAAMSAPLTYGIAAKAKHADCAAFFLNWVATNPAARTIDVQVGGSHPLGASGASMPAIKAGTVTAQTLAAGSVIGKENGSMDFIANATGAIYASAWTPELQKLFAGKETPSGLLSTVQADYKQELGG
jgi:raffinose/stachyose/melibiose transport system substrate-binding protein